MRTILASSFLTSAVILSSLYGIGDSSSDSPGTKRKLSYILEPPRGSFVCGGIEEVLEKLETGSDDDFALSLMLCEKAKEYEGDQGKTLLHMAASIGNLEKIKCLILYKFDPREKDDEDQVPADIAQGKDHREVAEFLSVCAQVYDINGEEKKAYKVISDADFCLKHLQFYMKFYEENGKDSDKAYEEMVEERQEELIREREKLVVLGNY